MSLLAKGEKLGSSIYNSIYSWKICPEPEFKGVNQHICTCIQFGEGQTIN
jgi:hypothetical protein